MKPDILNRTDIENIISRFYEKVKKDKLLSPFFSKTVKVDWQEHLVVMCDFWENVLFYTGNYQGNPLMTHKKLNEKAATKEVHFNRWLSLFEKSVDDLYQGKNAARMKAHAENIARIMQEKIR